MALHIHFFNQTLLVYDVSFSHKTQRTAKKTDMPQQQTFSFKL